MGTESQNENFKHNFSCYNTQLRLWNNMDSCGFGNDFFKKIFTNWFHCNYFPDSFPYCLQRCFEKYFQKNKTLRQARNDFKNYKSENRFFFSVRAFKCFFCGSCYFSFISADKYFVWSGISYSGCFDSFFKALCWCTLSKRCGGRFGSRNCHIFFCFVIYVLI